MVESRAFVAEVIFTKGKGHIPLPFDPDATWGKKGTHHVAGLVAGQKVRGPLAKVDGRHVLVMPPAWLRENAVAAGAAVEVELWAEGPQIEALPEDLADALEASPQAKAFFESLATFYRKAYLTWLAGSARRPRLREERLAQFIGLLEAGKKERPR